jgi:hypothetical protein
MNTRVIPDKTLSGDFPEELMHGDSTSSTAGDKSRTQLVAEFDTPNGSLQLLCHAQSPDSAKFYLVCARIKELLSLQKNWDSYGAESVKHEAVEDTFNLLGNLGVFDGAVEVPQMFATPNGNIQLEWVSNTKDIELQRTGRNLWELYVDDVENKKEIEEIISYDLSTLGNLLNR